MTPQDDLTAERAAATLDSLVVNVCPRDAREYNEAAIAHALKTARQEALREAKEEITSYLEKMGNKIPNSLVHRINMHERLDLLASEGA